MARRCSFCEHSQRAELEKMLIQGTATQTEIARKLGVTQGAISQHMKHHLAGEVEPELPEIEVIHAKDTIDSIRELVASAERIKEKAEKTGKLTTALAAVRELTRLIELMAKIEQRIDRPNQINIHANPDYLQFRNAVIQALEPYPEAKQALLARLST